MSDLAIDLLAETPSAVNQRVIGVLRETGPRLRSWLRRKLPQAADVDDVFQDVFYEFVLAQRAAQPIGDAAAWLFRVARNRVIDRARSAAVRTAAVPLDEDGTPVSLEDLLPDPRAGPDAQYARRMLMRELETAFAELPKEQREVFLAHELEGRSFADLSRESGIGVNTLIARKHYAVLSLRGQLKQAYEDWMESERSR